MANATPTGDFNSLATIWQAAYPWSPDGFSGGDQTSWLANPADLPANADPISLNNGIVTLSDFPTPSDVSPDQVGGMPRIGAQILTQDTFAQTYGYFQASIKMPSGTGVMGAFWMMPESGAWPPELDIAEVVGGDPTTVVNTDWHGSDTANSHWTDVSNTSAGFNTYAVDWTPSTITWYFNGQETFQAPTPSDMDQPMYMILGVTSGNSDSWEGAPKASLTAQMQVASVQAYSANPFTSGGTLTYDSGVAPPATDDVTVAAGFQKLMASANAEIFTFNGSGHQTVISDFIPGSDQIDFESANGKFSDVKITAGQAGNANISFGGNHVRLLGITPDQLGRSNFLFNVNGSGTTGS